MKPRKSKKLQAELAPVEIQEAEDLYREYDDPLDRWGNRTTYSLTMAHSAIEEILDICAAQIYEIDLKAKLITHIASGLTAMAKSSIR